MGALLTVAYDGTAYCGWQMQENAISIQEVLTNAINKTFSCDFSLLGASRTDAGVHALGQRAHLILSEPSKILIPKLPLVLNGHLPPDIRVMAAFDVPNSFHPINDAKSKTYRYTINNNRYRNPLLRDFSAFMPMPLDVAKMATAAKLFLGEHDFAAFCAKGSIVKSTVRTVYALEVAKQGDCVDITINGNGFLYNMVRIIAGTLVNVGLGRIAPEDIHDIILSRDRIRAGKTMPPQGLTLMEIFY
ncbi:MAG: tRNA pseudouridine(38-40) synthase TruA [Defluviitaleaceae bacterium]|nr:tRNA pseudouridine(38-40) synthase TruA [Defluviitaleaceae bacterium]